LKKSEDKTDVFEEKVIEEGVKSTRALIQTFLQTVKAYRLYEANHPILSKFMDRLKKDFDRYFNEFDSFSLQVGEHRLFYQGKVVYESQDVKESLAFFFFKDGIREIRFFEGLGIREIIDFLHVVRKSDFVNHLEDDLATLLWEKDFSHIVFTTVDEFLEGGGTLVPATEEDLLKGLEYRGSGEEGFEEKGGEGEADGSHVLVAEGLKQVMNPSPGQSLVQACQLNPNEVDEINREVQQEQRPEYVYLLIDNLIEILLHLGEDMDAYENMISYFERIIESLLQQNEVGKVVTILENLNDTMESMVLKDKQIFAIRRILEASSSSHSIELLGKAMKGNGEVESESILQYLRILTKQAIDPLCLLLGGLESGKWRKVVCDLLAELSREDIQPVSKFLSDRNSFLVCHILYILGKVGHPSTVKYLGKLVTHEDSKVREETLQLLNKFGEKGRDLIQKFLRDSVAEIRAKASLFFARVAKEGAVNPLMEIILSEDFYKRDYDEKSSFFRALVETGSKEAIPTLKKIAKKRRWFQGAQWNEIRLCATNTLKMMEADGRPDHPKMGKKLKQIERAIH
jgi:HEAT repeat protein